MEKKTVIVTGGGQGIGKAIAEKLVMGGYTVLIIGRTESTLNATTTELAAHGSAGYRVLDLGDRAAIVGFTQSWKKPIYGIVNNAGICKTERLDEMRDVWDEVMSTNLAAPYFLTKGLLPYLEDNGRIINISSQLGQEGRAGYSAYCASKFGVIGLTKTWAKELGVRGITVNAICPGWVATEMSEIDLARIAREKGIDPQEFYRQICEPLELKRFTRPEEVANLAAFLVSEEGSGVTGRDWLLNTLWNNE